MSIEKLQRDDHDTLIRLEGKVDNLTGDLKNLNTNLLERIADHEARLRTLERLAETTNPEANLKLMQDTASWVNSFRARWKLIIGIATILGTTVGAILTLVIEKLIGISTKGH